VGQSQNEVCIHIYIMLSFSYTFETDRLYPRLICFSIFMTYPLIPRRCLKLLNSSYNLLKYEGSQRLTFPPKYFLLEKRFMGLDKDQQTYAKCKRSSAAYEATRQAFLKHPPFTSWIFNPPELEAFTVDSITRRDTQMKKKGEKEG